jgi:hypothetical protein
MTVIQAGVVDLADHRAHRQTAATDNFASASRAERQPPDIFSMAFFGFWPGMVWLPLPFDTKPADQRRSRTVRE